MKEKLFLAVLFCFFSITTVSGLDKVILTNGEWLPYTSENLPNYGVLSDIVTKAFEKENVTVEYVFVPWKRAYAFAVEGAYDGSIGWQKL